MGAWVLSIMPITVTFETVVLRMSPTQSVVGAMTPEPRAISRNWTRYVRTIEGSLAKTPIAENAPCVDAEVGCLSASTLDRPGRPAAMGGPKNCTALTGAAGDNPSVSASWLLSALASMTTLPGCVFTACQTAASLAYP